MSQALETYRDSGETLTSNEPAGELAEILAESEVKGAFTDASIIKTNVEIYNKRGNQIGEFDYVVLNQNSTVIGVVEVKHTNGDAGKAARQMRTTLRDLDEDSRVTNDLNTTQFIRNSENIRQFSIGPSSHKRWMEEKDVPKDALRDYDEHIDLSEEEIKDLADEINNR